MCHVSYRFVSNHHYYVSRYVWLNNLDIILFQLLLYLIYLTQWYIVSFGATFTCLNTSYHFKNLLSCFRAISYFRAFCIGTNPSSIISFPVWLSCSSFFSLLLYLSDSLHYLYCLLSQKSLFVNLKF